MCIRDRFTPSGVQLINPVSSVKFKKRAGFTLLAIWVGCVIASVVLYGNNFLSIIAVSYTHLDVYKRQNQTYNNQKSIYWDNFFI